MNHRSKHYLKLYIIFNILIFLSCEVKKTDPRIKTETRALLEFYIAKDLQRDSIYLSKTPIIFQTEQCVNQIINSHKDINLTARQILEQTGADTIQWNNDLIPNAKILNEKGLIKFQNLVESNKTKEGNFMISHPIFFNDFHLAIMKVSFYCGSRCGQSGTLVFEKKNNEWHLLKTYCTTIS